MYCTQDKFAGASAFNHGPHSYGIPCHSPWPRRHRLLFLLLILLIPNPLLAAIGQVQFVRGGVVAQQPQSAPRLLGRDAEVLLDDVLDTEADSFVVIRFNDETKLTLRPVSRLSIEAYEQRAGKEQILFALDRGGLQAEAGRIGRAGKGDFRVRTPHGTLRVRGARFSARLCDGDCAPDGLAPIAGEQADEAVRRLAARVVKLRGQAHVDSGKQRHQLEKGSPLYPDDQVVTGERSYLTMAFRDGGRISLVQNSRFHIQHFDYQGQPGETPASGKATLHLLKGGLRALSGFIGKEREEDYEIVTPVTTIGVRGTGFDSLCLGDCLSPGDTPARGPDGSYNDGLYNHVWADTIVQRLPAGPALLHQGQTAYLPNPGQPPELLPERPPFLRQLDAPRPDQLVIDLPALFASRRLDDQAPGLYVYMETGTGTLEGLEIGRGEALYKGPRGLFRLHRPTDFQRRDLYPAPWQPLELLQQRHSLLKDDETLITDFACKVK